MPWETPPHSIVYSVQGQVAKVLGVIIIVIGLNESPVRPIAARERTSRFPPVPDCLVPVNADDRTRRGRTSEERIGRQFTLQDTVDQAICPRLRWKPGGGAWKPLSV